MKYRVDLDGDGNLIYIPISADEVGPTVYDIDIGSDGEISYAPTDSRDE